MNNDNPVARRIGGLVLAFLMCVVPMPAQEQLQDDLTKNRDEFLRKKETVVSAMPGVSAVPMESIVNPDYYVVGPGDVITVTVWMSPPLSMPLMVTPEGTLIIPTVGEVRLGHCTLANAKEQITAAVRKNYVVAQISVTLTRPREVTVSVLGEVLHSGTHTRHASERVNALLDAAMEAQTKAEMENIDDIRKGMSLRKIIVRHRDGTSQRVDLVAYRATGKDSANPYLREGDIVIVPRREQLTNSIAVWGEVNVPGRMEYVPGDSFLEAVALAQGLGANAIPESVLFSRQGKQGEVLKNTVLSLTDMMQGLRPDFELLPGDRIIVPRKEEIRGDYNVDVRGEVRRPGTYPITRNATKLSEILAQAGGATSEASLNAAHIVRNLYVQDKDDVDLAAGQRGGLFAEDSLGLSIERQIRSGGERVSVNIARLMEGDASQDVVLQADDEIVIPSLRRSVYVFGQVMTPGHIPFVSGEGVRYYVNRAGGYTDNARSGEVKIIKAGTKQWLSPGETEIEDGDYIWVPQEQQRPFSYYLNVASQAAGVIGVLLGITALIIQLSR